MGSKLHKTTWAELKMGLQWVKWVKLVPNRTYNRCSSSSYVLGVRMDFPTDSGTMLSQHRWLKLEDHISRHNLPQRVAVRSLRWHRLLTGVIITAHSLHVTTSYRDLVVPKLVKRQRVRRRKGLCLQHRQGIVD